MRYLLLIIFLLWDIEVMIASEKFVFAHGLGGNKDQILWYKKGNSINWSIISDNYYTFNFPDVGNNQSIDRSQVNLAQENDINALAKACSDFDNVVIVGVSRGAATAITYCGTKNPKNIKALILEAPFDTVENIIKHQVDQSKNKQQAYEIFSSQWSFPLYNKNGIKPDNVIANIDKNIPVLLIHSKTDGLISIESSINLHNKLKQAGHKHVYLLKLDSGQHANYQLGADALKYQETVHAFYKRCGIQCNEILAASGKKYLENCKH